MKNQPTAYSHIFVGGCHVRGYLVGEKSSFAELSLLSPDTFFKRSVNSYLSTPTSVRRASKVIQSLIAAIDSETILVLQLGNFEANGRLFFTRQIRSSVSASPNNLKKISTMGLLKILAQSLIKVPYLITRNLTSNPVFDKKDFKKQVEDLFIYTDSIGFRNVIVLSPFPTLQPSINICRCQASNILMAAAQDFGYDYINMYEKFSLDFSKYFGNKEYFIDGEHLNEAGHCLIASELSKRYKSYTSSKVV